MTTLVLDTMETVAPWVALAPDGVTPSSELTIKVDDSTAGWGVDARSGRIAASAAALGHQLRRRLADVNLTAYSELRISVKVDAAPRANFLMEIGLASALTDFDDPANKWHRLIPAETHRGWAVMTMSLDDLVPSVATAVTGMRLRCKASSFALHVDDVIATQPRLVADAGVAAPALDIRQFDIRFAPKRVVDTPVRRDFTGSGYREYHAGTPYDLDYAIYPVTDSRAVQAQLIEGVLARVPANGDLVINGDRATIELVSTAGSDRIGGEIGERPILVYRLGVRAPATSGPRFVDVERVEFEADLLPMS